MAWQLVYRHCKTVAPPFSIHRKTGHRWTRVFNSSASSEEHDRTHSNAFKLKGIDLEGIYCIYRTIRRLGT